MSTTAEGQHDGVTPAGPDNKFDGCTAAAGVDNRGPEQDVKQGLRITMPWKVGQDAPAASGFALGANQPD